VFSITLLVLFAVVSAWAQPPALLDTDWNSGSDNALFDNADEQTSGPVVYDLTGDGQKEVIVTGRKNIWVFNLDHPDMSDPVFATWTPVEGYEFCSPVTVAHLSSDGYPWIVVGASVAVHYAQGDCPCPAGWVDPNYPNPNCHGTENGD